MRSNIQEQQQREFFILMFSFLRFYPDEELFLKEAEHHKESYSKFVFLILHHKRLQPFFYMLVLPQQKLLEGYHQVFLIYLIFL
jgi:hypothetical protein